MNIRNLTIACLAAAMVGTAVPDMLWAQAEKTTWDDLQLVKSDRSSRLYLLPGADFTPYNKVMIDPVEVAFQKNWIRDYNRTVGSLTDRIREEDANKALERLRSGSGAVFAEEFQKAGYQVVQAPGPDVLRLRLGVMDVTINAPDVKRGGRSYTSAWEAGQATLVVEARDSTSDQLLGRALDRRIAGDTQARARLRNSVTNQADFTMLFRQWAGDSIEGLNKLRASAAGGLAQK